MRKIFFVLCSLFCFGACNPPPKDEGKSLVWVSIAPYQHLAQRLVGPDVQVETIIPQNINPHSFDPTSRQVSYLKNGLIWFRIGEPFEKKILPLLKEINPLLLTFDLRENVELLEAEDGCCAHLNKENQDRHIWMSPKDTKIQVMHMAKALQEMFPEKKQEIAQNLDKLLEDLTQLDNEIRSLLSSLPLHTILVSHPAFGYFCRDYPCKQLSVEYEGKEPRPKQIEELLSQAAAFNTKVAIALPQHNNKGAQLLAEKLHIPVHMLDPYSANYFDTLISLAKIITSTKEPIPYERN